VSRAGILAVLMVLSGCAAIASKEAVIGCQAADAATTLHATSLGAEELNPFVGWLLGFGPMALIAAKAGVTLLVLHHHAELPRNLLVAANGITCAVAANNARIAAELAP